jgi:hypothetical protein
VRSARGSGLAELGETRGPLDGWLTAEKGRKDGDFGLVELASKRAGAGESDDHGVAAVMRNTLLTTVVRGLLRTNV